LVWDGTVCTATYLPNATEYPKGKDDVVITENLKVTAGTTREVTMTMDTVGETNEVVNETPNSTLADLSIEKYIDNSVVSKKLTGNINIPAGTSVTIGTTKIDSTAAGPITIP
jgi:hypothetical protein